jgi:hypothetical protein
MVAKRSFQVSNVQNVDGCPTKFRKGRYLSANPNGAAKKAFNGLCNLKRIKGKCTLLVTVRETTAGTNKKEFTYKLNRTRLSKPLVMMEGTDKEFRIYYEISSHSTKNLPKCKSGRKRTRGPMKHKSRRSGKKMSKKVSRKNKSTKKTIGNNKNNKKNGNNVSMRKNNNNRN